MSESLTALRKYLVPGLVFQSVVIGGGYGTGREIAEFFLKQWLELWKERNGDRHGKDRESQAAAAKRQAIREVEGLYQHQNYIEPHLRWTFKTPLDQMKQKRTYVLRAWISNFGPVLKKSHEYQTRLETG